MDDIAVNAIRTLHGDFDALKCATCNHTYIEHAGYGGPCLVCSRTKHACKEFVEREP